MLDDLFCRILLVTNQALRLHYKLALVVLHLEQLVSTFLLLGLQLPL